MELKPLLLPLTPSVLYRKSSEYSPNWVVIYNVSSLLKSVRALKIQNTYPKQISVLNTVAEFLLALSNTAPCFSALFSGHLHSISVVSDANGEQGPLCDAAGTAYPGEYTPPPPQKS